MRPGLLGLAPRMGSQLARRRCTSKEAGTLIFSPEGHPVSIDLAKAHGVVLASALVLNGNFRRWPQ